MTAWSSSGEPSSASSTTAPPSSGRRNVGGMPRGSSSHSSSHSSDRGMVRSMPVRATPGWRPRTAASSLRRPLRPGGRTDLVAGSGLSPPGGRLREAARLRAGPRRPPRPVPAGPSVLMRRPLFRPTTEASTEDALAPASRSAPALPPALVDGVHQPGPLRRPTPGRVGATATAWTRISTGPWARGRLHRSVPARTLMSTPRRSRMCMRELALEASAEAALLIASCAALTLPSAPVDGVHQPGPLRRPTPGLAGAAATA